MPLLVSPLISYGNDAFCPCTCCPHIKLRQDRQHCSLWSIFFPCCCIEHLFHVTSNHLISNSCSPLTYEDFLNVVYKVTIMASLPWKSCPFYCQFLDEDVFIIFYSGPQSSRNCTIDSTLCVLKKLLQSRLTSGLLSYS